jgi:hypothetical protein
MSIFRERRTAIVLSQRTGARYLGGMTESFPVVVLTACLVVLGVLVFGFASFARGGAFNRRWSNKIMQLRVALQFMAVIVIVAMAYFMR